MRGPTLLNTQFPSLSALLHESAEPWQRLHWEIVGAVRLSSNYKTTAAKSLTVSSLAFCVAIIIKMKTLNIYRTRVRGSF